VIGDAPAIGWREISGFLFATRWGVLLFLAAMPLVWIFEFVAPRRWWLVFLSLLSLTFIAFTLMPWPSQGTIPAGAYPLQELPAVVPLSWQRRVVLGLLHVGILLTMLAGVYRLASKGRRRSDLRVSVLLLLLGFFGLLLIRTAGMQIAGGAYAIDAWILIPEFHEAGLAYVFVKSVIYVWDCQRGRIHNRSWWRFLSWITFFPSFRVGPIERFHDFHTQILRCHRRWRPHDLVVGLARILLGVLKCSLLLVILTRAAPWASALWQRSGEDLANVPYWFPWTVIWLVALGAYLALAGYSDIAIGLARLMGYRMVENFRGVLLSHNLIELWHRVHISMSSFLRDYCYYPLIRRGPFRRRPPQPAGAQPASRREELKRLLIPSVNYHITFFLAGLWHSPSPLNALIWGACLGSGMTLVEVWHWYWGQRAAENGPLYRVLCRTGFAGGGAAGRVLGVVVTMNFVSVTLLALFHPRAFVGITWEIIRRPIAGIF
jgi:D-alanyl-lipoteichoic acid acyltransferase DltB (MBOAT superfamily)